MIVHETLTFSLGHIVRAIFFLFLLFALIKTSSAEYIRLGLSLLRCNE